MDIQTRMHTVFLLVGATECGKSTFATEVLVPQLRLADESRGLRTNVQVLSSDAIRQELLGHACDKYDQIMQEASASAFRLLFERLKLATSFPINAEFVVVDTTGLAEDFRGEVRRIVRENGYNLEVILFDYRDRDDYYDSERSRRLISNHLNRLRRDVLPVLAREEYDRIHKIRAKNFYDPSAALPNPAYRVTVTDWEAYTAAVLPRQWSYIVVGDVHERVGELQALLGEFGYRVEAGKLAATERVRNTRIVLAGDWIDKGGQTREIVEFLHANLEHFLLVKGNHENFVCKYIRGEIKGAEPELLRDYFDSTKALAEDGELFAKFAELVEASRPFYRYIGDGGPSFYVTHAPCRNKYIGKLGAYAARQQRSFRVDKMTPLESQLEFLQQEAAPNQPLHLFGHIAASKPFRIRNKIHLDTGAAYGNALTGVLVGSRPLFRSCKSQAKPTGEALPTLFRAEKNVSLRELDEEAARKLAYSARNGINFISGTMAPADKDAAAGELESLKRGLDHFADRGVFEVTLQPKYMGSRCGVYLFRDIARCYAVSRNGYKVKAVDLTGVYEALLRRFGGYMTEQRVAAMLLDGELLPWKALGDGLIEAQFRPIGAALASEHAFLREHGFEEALGQLLEEYETSGFGQDRNRMSKAELSAKYGDYVYQNYKSVAEIRPSLVPLAVHEEAGRVYSRQLELYAGEAELAYKPFALLKEVLESGEERMPAGAASEMFRFLNDDETIALDLREPDACARAERYFAELTAERGMEGVVIKPERGQRGIVPCMKVRNPGYLSIIYGYDYRFPQKYAKLIKQKSVVAKLRASANEHRLGMRMLAVKLADIAPDNAEYMQTAANMLFETTKEQEIDPRL